MFKALKMQNRIFVIGNRSSFCSFFSSRLFCRLRLRTDNRSFGIWFGYSYEAYGSADSCGACGDSYAYRLHTCYKNAAQAPPDRGSSRKVNKNVQAKFLYQNDHIVPDQAPLPYAGCPAGYRCGRNDPVRPCDDLL